MTSQKALTLQIKHIQTLGQAKAVHNDPPIIKHTQTIGIAYLEKRTNMKEHKLAQKRHKRNLKRKNKTFDNKKHNKNLLEYCKKILPHDEYAVEL